MVRISTFVFFDIETTGLPHQEFNRTKIIELSFVAATRSDIRRHKGTIPPVSKLTFLLNPQKTITSAHINGLTNEMVKYSPTFKQKINTINTFLEVLNKPVCLVAHNGNIFDYKILLAECVDAGVKLPADLLCVDSLSGFRKLLNNKISKPQTSIDHQLVIDESISILTDDEDEWPNLDITPEEFQEIDELCSSLSNLSCDNSQNEVPKKRRKKVKIGEKKPRESYKLTDIYRKLLNKEPDNAHRAESDCLMLLQCVGVCQNSSDTSEDFLRWMDDNCKNLNEIQPLIRK